MKSEKCKCSGLESTHCSQSEKPKKDNLHKTHKNNNFKIRTKEKQQCSDQNKRKTTMFRPEQKKNNNVQTRSKTIRKIKTQAWLTQQLDKKLR